MQEIILKRVLFGGYDCYEVMNHINALQTKLNRTKADAERLAELNREAELLRKQIAERDAEIAVLEAALSESDRGSRTDTSKSLAQQTQNYADSYVEAAHSLERSVRELTAQQTDDARQRIAALGDSLDEISGAVGELYVLFSNLREEYGGINQSYDEIVRESSKIKKSKASPKKKKAKEPKKSETKSTGRKSPDVEAIELLNKTEERYKKI